MSEDKKSLIDLVPDSVDNAVKNITDKPTQNMGTTLADIWYLVFGGISQAAEKRKLKYAYALQEFENELKEKISKIPEDKLTEPNIQVIAPALEASKYCIETEELRHIFTNLISSAMCNDKYIPPVLVNIISCISPIDAKILKYLYINNGLQIDLNLLIHYLNIFDIELIHLSLIELEYMKLIYNDSYSSSSKFVYANINNEFINIENTRITSLGAMLCNICLS